jgi:hypothetical protein
MPMPEEKPMPKKKKPTKKKTSKKAKKKWKRNVIWIILKNVLVLSQILKNQ